MGKKSAPAAPDYTAAAQAQADQSKENLTQQTWANRADQFNPWGSQTWSSQAAVDPATGQPITKWSQSTNLDPRLQQALDSQIDIQNQRSGIAQNLLGRVESEFGQPMQWGQLGAWGQGPAQAGGLQAYTNPYGFGPRLETGMGRGAAPIQMGLDYSGLQDVQGSGQQRQRAEDAIYQSAASRLDPQWQQRQQSIESDLANRGITRGSDAYSRAMADFGRDRTDAYQQAQMAAITGGGAEAQRNYGMDIGLRQQQATERGQLGQFGNQAQQQAFQQSIEGGQARNAALGQGYQFGMNQQQQAFGQQQQAGAQNFQQQLAMSQYQNQLRQQQLQEMIQQRGFSLNEMQALLNGQQVSMPQFGGYSQAGVAEGADLMGAAKAQYSASMDQYNAKQAQTAGLMQGLGSMGSMAMMFSDRRIKADVRRIGRDPRGWGIYSYRFIGERGRRVGVIAQDVQRVAPQLVRVVNGVLAVDAAAFA